MIFINQTGFSLHFLNFMLLDFFKAPCLSDKTMMVFGDAKKVIEGMVKAVE
jgi:hypothetical protein